jgi:hypothetical protein
MKVTRLLVEDHRWSEAIVDDDEITSGRRLLREHGNVRMWLEYVAGPHRDTGQLLRYFVGRSNETPALFTAPCHAFHHFQKLTAVDA